ncbi:uroporphyrinogen III synthase-like protein [Leishmania panamensis]|uniref:Uroporphyrinogen III synthase-like protein, putative n=1 Tax=Leishmania panamensis TaxID=5679 RepID=A0A088RHD9_LEIPA|nr:uroporphyrinogen III synthase-like protein [Leishmania panamensis]AIN95298.1 uroporphyrinogen III synthase-like protein [Leishmania panamensis]
MSKTILVAAPEVYSKRFAQALEVHHLIPIAVPVIKTIATPDTADMRTLLENDLDDIDYIAFCSRCAVDSLSAALNHRYGCCEELVSGRTSSAPVEDEGKRATIVATVLAKCTLIAIGKDADYVLERLRILPGICPDEPSPAGIAAKLAEGGRAEGRTIAVLAPCVGGFAEPDVVPRFVDQLKGMGMRVVRVDAYVTRPVSEEAVSAAVTALTSGSVHCVAFTSASEISVLLSRSPQCLANIDVACFGPYTAGFAAQHGVTVSCVAKDFSSFDGFAAAIAQHYARR